MRILGLDLSKRSTGWAVWGPEDARAVIGHWRLGSEFTDTATTFCRLHECMTELQMVVGDIDAVFAEEPRQLASFNVQSSAELHFLEVGLFAHACSWSKGAPSRGGEPHHRIWRGVNMSTWRRTFIGKMKRGTKRVDLKAYALARARELGFRPKNDDEAEGLGVLDYACEALGITPYWRAEHPLVQQFGSTVH